MKNWRLWNESKLTWTIHTKRDRGHSLTLSVQEWHTILIFPHRHLFSCVLSTSVAGIINSPVSHVRNLGIALDALFLRLLTCTACLSIPSPSCLAHSCDSRRGLGILNSSQDFGTILFASKVLSNPYFLKKNLHSRTCLLILERGEGNGVGGEKSVWERNISWLPLICALTRTDPAA